MSDTIIIEDVDFHQALSVAAALAIEINTGLGHSRGSVMNVAKRYCGSPKRTKKGVLRDYVAWLQAQVPTWEPNPRVHLAMGK